MRAQSLDSVGGETHATAAVGRLRRYYLYFTARARERAFDTQHGLLKLLCNELRAAGLSCEVQGDEATMLWGRLCFLAPFALSTTASGGTLGAVRSDAGWHSRLESCVTEACSVAIAEGAKLTPQPVLAALEGAPDSLRSSMQKDVAAGRTPELDAIVGPILRGGNEHGNDVPTTRALVDHIARAR